MELFSEAEKEDILLAIYLLSNSVANLPYALYYKIGQDFSKSLFDSYGQNLITVRGAKDEELLNKLYDNVFMFSAAKTFQQTKDITNFIYDNNGNKRPYAEYKADATVIFDQYNTTFQEPEKVLTGTAAKSAALWASLTVLNPIAKTSKEVWLRYKTQEDNRVRPSHRKVNNVTKPINDIFWDAWFPPNSWNCRCYTVTVAAPLPILVNQYFGKPETLFNYNPGKDKIIFRKSHPYFNVGNKYEQFKRDNFGLVIPR